MPRTRLWPLALALPLLIATPAAAVGPRAFTLEGADRLQGGDAQDVSVDAEGRITPGMALGKLAVGDATTAFAALPLPSGEVLLGTAPDGKVYRVKGDEVTLYADTKTLAVTALARAADGKVYAATMPEGKIFRLEAGKAELFATAPTENLFALVAGKQGLFAAGGDPGQIFRIDERGKVESYWKSEEPTLTALAIDDAGTLWAGSSGKGILFKVTGPGRATVVHDFPGDEVRAIVPTARGVYAIANEYSDAVEVSRRTPGKPAGPAAATRPRAGKGQLARITGDGLVEVLWRASDTALASLAVDGPRVLVGTSAEGRVYQVDDDHRSALLFDGEERQIAAIVPSDGRSREAFFVGSDPVLFRRRLPQAKGTATWTSKPLDAGLVARFGAASWEGVGVAIESRSGNTASPDGTWSPWAAIARSGGAIASPAGRYLQLRARFTDSAGVVTRLSASFQTENARPVVTEVLAAPKGGLVAKESGGGVTASGGDPGKRDATVRVTWKVDNADADPLRYRIAFLREGQSAARELLKPEEFLTKTEYDWDTSPLAEGRYRVRVEASDEAANPLGAGKRHALLSDPIVVDNSPPTVTLALDGRRLRGAAKDGTSAIARVEVATDGRLDFRALAAKDGLFDGLEESFDVDLSPIVPPGAHLVVVRVWDAAGNVTTREVDAR